MKCLHQSLTSVLEPIEIHLYVLGLSRGVLVYPLLLSRGLLKISRGYRVGVVLPLIAELYISL